MDGFDRQERNFSWVSLSASSKSYDSIVEELRECRRRVMNIVVNDKRPGQGLSLQFSAFPTV